MRKNVKKISKDKTYKKETRRDFLKTAWKGLGIVAGLEFAGLAIHYLNDHAQEPDLNNIFDAGLAEEIPKGTVTPFRRGRFYLVRLADGGFLAVSIKCTHLGCSILWDEEKQEFICPCHSSHFAINGDVNNPPAPRALDIYELKIENGQIVIDLNKKNKRAGFEKSQLTYA
ncbi:MAG: ubiquinol-cytochrome c reductase iron-sulfur subunit [Melioribacteraceae bacterium]|nr:ubiquinol-cytochrome c reductase iron-sulfur subunit [Melioribacteraceae bacterium]